MKKTWEVAIWLISILSVSRMVLLWFGPQDIMQTIPQPCKAWEKPGWGEMGDVSYFPWVFWCWARP